MWEPNTVSTARLALHIKLGRASVQKCCTGCQESGSLNSCDKKQLVGRAPGFCNARLRCWPLSQFEWTVLIHLGYGYPQVLNHVIFSTGGNDILKTDWWWVCSNSIEFLLNGPSRWRSCRSFWPFAMGKAPGYSVAIGTFRSRYAKKYLITVNSNT